MTVVAAPALRFVCPRCRGDLDAAPGGYGCASCAARYPIVAGIPDFRLRQDPWIGIEEDRAKALQLEGLTEGMEFADAVRAYWAITPATPTSLAVKFTEHVLHAESRSQQWLGYLNAEETAAPPGSWLELGCGTGDLLAAAAAQGVAVVGIDIALRWLVVARRRLGPAAQLVCCGAEHLPFPDGCFARVLALGLLEHCPDAGVAVAEARRVLVPGGVLRLRTVNRYSLLGEPHVGLWGVGFLPRQWADAYVRWRTGQPYSHHRPLSVRELRGALRRSGFRGVRAEPAAPLPSETARLGRAGRAAVVGYRQLRRTLGLRRLLAWFAPLLEARGVAE